MGCEINLHVNLRRLPVHTIFEKSRGGTVVSDVVVRPLSVNLSHDKLRQVHIQQLDANICKKKLYTKVPALTKTKQTKKERNKCLFYRLTNIVSPPVVMRRFQNVINKMT